MTQTKIPHRAAQAAPASRNTGTAPSHALGRLSRGNNSQGAKSHAGGKKSHSQQKQWAKTRTRQAPALRNTGTAPSYALGQLSRGNNSQGEISREGKEVKFCNMGSGPAQALGKCRHGYLTTTSQSTSIVAAMYLRSTVASP